MRDHNDLLMVGERHERKMHPGVFTREVFIRPAIRPDNSPQPIGSRIRDHIAEFVEEHGPYILRQSRRFFFRSNRRVHIAARSRHLHIRVGEIATAIDDWIWSSRRAQAISAAVVVLSALFFAAAVVAALYR